MMHTRSLLLAGLVFATVPLPVAAAASDDPPLRAPARAEPNDEDPLGERPAELPPLALPDDAEEGESPQPLMPLQPPAPPTRVFQRAPQAQDDADLDDARGDQAGTAGAPPRFTESPPAEDADGIDWRIDDRLARHPAHQLNLNFGIWPDSVSGSAWWALPLLPRGLLRGVNDSFHLEFGTILIASNLWATIQGDQFDILPAVGVRWDFHLTRSWVTFATVKLGPRIGLVGSARVRPDPVLAMGTLLGLGKRVDLRMEIGYPQGFVFGLSFPIGAQQ